MTGRTSSRRALAVTLIIAAAVASGACGGDGDGTADDVRTIAFLRAVPGTGITEPIILEELRTAGLVEGQNLTVVGGDPQEAHPDPDDAAAIARQWGDEGVDLIVAFSSTGAAAVRDNAPSIPVLFLSNDPVATGLVRDEQQPEGNLTGATFRVPADRTLDLTRRAIPGLERIGLVRPAGDAAAEANEMAVAEAAGRLAIGLQVEEVADPGDGDAIAAAVARLSESGVDALLLSNSPAAVNAIPATSAAAHQHALPVVANVSYADDAVVALYPDSEELARQLGRQAARILTGAPPASVPVEDPRRFLVRLNLARAQELGLELPPDLIREANEVVE